MLINVRRFLAILAATLLTALVSVPLATAAPTPTPTPSASSDGQTPTATADPQDLASFGIAPAGAERADDRPFLAMSAAAGSVIYDHVAIINQDDQPIDLNVYAGDVIMAEGGGLSVRARADKNTDAGSWITVDGPGTIAVPAQTAEHGYGFTIVPIAIAIPANAQPGDHIGGLVASLVTSGQGTNTPTIELEQRVAARIYIRVAGDLAPGLTVTKVKASWAPASLLGKGAVTVTYTLRNTGNMRMAIDPAVTVAGPFGLLPRSAPGDRVDELLPGGETTQTATVEGVWALVRHNVTIDARVVAPTGGEDPGLGTVSASTVMWAIPWLALGVLLLLVALIVYAQLRRRRRRRRDAAADSGSRRSRRASPSKLADQAVHTSSSTSEDHVPAGVEQH
jgi:hypothetical protein